MNSSLRKDRPLSPHLQIYKIQITSFLSILHRATGVVLFVGTTLWAFWFLALAIGPESYRTIQGFLLSPFGLLILLGWSFSFFYHLCNGFRHLIWDAGYGYDINTVRNSGWLVVVCSILLTLLTWILSLMSKEIWV